MHDFKNLRVRRFRNGISKGQIAERLGCSVSWINSLEKSHYSGNARDEWCPRYEAALETLIAEKRDGRV